MAASVAHRHFIASLWYFRRHGATRSTPRSGHGRARALRHDALEPRPCGGRHGVGTVAFRDDPPPRDLLVPALRVRAEEGPRPGRVLRPDAGVPARPPRSEVS